MESTAQHTPESELRALEQLVKVFCVKVEKTLAEDALCRPKAWERLWVEAHSLDHLHSWEVADRGPSYANLHTKFSSTMDLLTLAGLRLQRVE